MQVVIVGCGGLFFHGVRNFGPALRRMNPATVVLVDGDTLEEENQERQWFGRQPGKTKTKLADAELLAAGLRPSVVSRLDVQLVEGPTANGALCQRLNSTDPILMLCMPDNDLCRRAARRLCRRLADPDRVVYLVLAGCDEEHGKSIVELFNGASSLTNPLRWDMSEDNEEEGGCGVRQNELSNGLVGLFVADQVAQVDRMRRGVGGGREGSEYFTNYCWRRDRNGGIAAYGDTYKLSWTGTHLRVEMVEHLVRRPGRPGRPGVRTGETQTSGRSNDES